MNNYKQRYVSINKNIEDIKNNKKKLANELEEKEAEYDNKEEVVDDIREEITEMESQRNSIIKNKEKLIDLVTNILTVALLAGTIALGIISYNAIAPVRLMTLLLTLTGVTSGGITFFAFALAVIKIIDKKLKKKNTDKNKRKPEYIKLTEKINKKNKELDNEIINKNQIITELYKLENEIYKQQELLSTKKEELAHLIEEIVQETIKEEPASEEIIKNLQIEEPVYENTKSYTRIKRPEHQT